MLTPVEQQRALNGTVVVSGQRVHENVDGKLRGRRRAGDRSESGHRRPAAHHRRYVDACRRRSVETVTTFLLVVYPLLVVLLSALAWPGRRLDAKAGWRRCGAAPTRSAPVIATSACYRCRTATTRSIGSP